MAKLWGQTNMRRNAENIFRERKGDELEDTITFLPDGGTCVFCGYLGQA